VWKPNACLQVTAKLLWSHRWTMTQRIRQWIPQCKISRIETSKRVSAAAANVCYIWMIVITVAVLLITVVHVMCWQLVFGNCGVLQGVTQGKGFVNMSTVDVETANDVSEVNLSYIYKIKITHISIFFRLLGMPHVSNRICVKINIHRVRKKTAPLNMSIWLYE